MTNKFTAPPKWRSGWTTGDAKADEMRQKALMALAKTHELAEEGLAGAKLKALASDALDYIDACLKYEELWQRAQGKPDFGQRVAKLERWREQGRKLAGSDEFWAFAAKWWESYLSL